ncbi:MAG: hypothetical protein M2R45_01146 [Verrucomicrobia subdivision 3 bacterium]|nr:hypothetical protein [Limisphaerales bacterium]MCS1415300.1 hypothetical protein [Limisphaerales bacterium]
MWVSSAPVRCWSKLQEGDGQAFVVDAQLMKNCGVEVAHVSIEHDQGVFR